MLNHVLELTHVTIRVAAHPMTPRPPLCVMVAQPAHVTRMTQVPLILVHEAWRTVPRHSPSGGPMTRHGPPPPPPPSPPLPGWVSSVGCMYHSSNLRNANFDH